MQGVLLFHQERNKIDFFFFLQLIFFFTGIFFRYRKIPFSWPRAGGCQAAVRAWAWTVPIFQKRGGNWRADDFIMVCHWCFTELQVRAPGKAETHPSAFALNSVRLRVSTVPPPRTQSPVPSGGWCQLFQTQLPVSKATVIQHQCKC